MCNAQNHPPTCRCGWGDGDGAGGYGRGRSARTRTARFTPCWSGTRAPSTYESYTNPNASCPVCGAAVFFYRSPHGGRVFFDELGVPWPKHPCTDTSFYWRFGQVKLRTASGAPGGAAAARTPEIATPRRAWRPLLITSADQLEQGVSRIRPRDMSIPGCLYLPRQFVEQPAAWRWSATTPGFIEASTFALTEDGRLLEQQVTQPGCLLDDADWHRHEHGNQDWTRQQLVALGLAAAGGVGVGSNASRDYVLAHQLLWKALFMGEPDVEHLVVLDNVTKSLFGSNDQSSRRAPSPTPTSFC